MRNNLAVAFSALVLIAPAIVPVHAQERREIPEQRVFGEPASDQDAESLTAALDSYIAAWAEEDTPAIVALHASDTEWINAYARMFRGADALGEFFEHRLFPAFSPETSKREAENMTLISTRYVGDSAAVHHLYTDGDRGPSVIEGRELRRTHFHFVWEKQDDGWKIVHTAIMDAR